LLHPEDRERAVQALRNHLRGETDNYEAEFRLRNNDNQWQWIHARGKIIEYDTDGKPLRFVGTHTDITSRKMMEDSLVKSTEETKMFAYSVAHDLKNPALAVRGLAVRFRTKLFELTETQKQMYCDRIMESSDQIVELIEKINDFISSKETSPVFVAVPLKEIVRTSRNEFAAQLQYRSIAWREFAENPIIRLDRMSIIRVLRNLIENSLKYGGPGLSKITIGYQNTPGYHVISVLDNGVGMTVEDAEKIFQPFERTGRSAEQGGSGLGLAIVKEIANKHKGEVWVEPNKKRGVQFCFAISKSL
jgi:signal transduction histidine kinase